MTNERINELTKQLEKAISELMEEVDSNSILVDKHSDHDLKIRVQVYHRTTDKLPQEDVKYIRHDAIDEDGDYYEKQVSVNGVTFIELLDMKQALESFKKSIA